MLGCVAPNAKVGSAKVGSAKVGSAKWAEQRRQCRVGSAEVPVRD